MPTATSLNKIRNKRVKNIVRGIIAAKDPKRAIAPLTSFRKEASPSDAMEAYAFLGDSPLALHVPLPKPFPKDIEEIDTLPFFAETPLATELAIQKVRLAEDEDALVGCIELLSACSERALADDMEGISEQFSRFQEEYGLSLQMMLKAVSIRQSHLKNDAGLHAINSYVRPFLSPRRKLFAVAFEDSVDEEYGYLRPRRSFAKLIDRGLITGRYKSLLDEIWSAEIASENEASMRLQAISHWSLLDVVAFLFRLHDQFKLKGQAEAALNVRETIPEKVRSVWQRSFKNVEVKRLVSLLGGEPEFAEKRLFAHALAWSEFPNINRYRIDVESAIGKRLRGDFHACGRSAESFSTVYSSGGELLKKTKTKIGLHKVNPKSCGKFHRTIALVAAIENGGLKIANGEELLDLLDTTVDVATMLSSSELKMFLPARAEDPLYTYLRTALLFDAEENKVSQHAVRRAVQDIVTRFYDGDIVEFAKAIDSDEGHVANHFYNLCSEYFLTELYDLFEETDDVIEAHAQLLEWFGRTRNDEDAVLRAKSHRLNLLLRKVRGSIDDNRIYVDPLRFIQWTQDKYGSELRSVMSLIDSAQPLTGHGGDIDNPVKKIENPSVKLLSLFDACYRAFCTDKYNGVDSYIGRRIRHGTLHGFMVAEIRASVEAAIKNFQADRPAIATFLEDWFEKYDKAVQHMAQDKLFVNSKDKPEGLIQPTINDGDKITALTSMYSHIVKELGKHSHLVPVFAQIHEYCWILFEVDLKRIKQAFDEMYQASVINPNHPRLAELVKSDPTVQDTVKSLNADLQHRFNTVRTWLARPTSVSPSASIELLVQAVLDEIRDRYPSLTHDPILEGDTKLDLLGHRFQFFYDALFVLT